MQLGFFIDIGAVAQRQLHLIVYQAYEGSSPFGSANFIGWVPQLQKRQGESSG